MNEEKWITVCQFKTVEFHIAFWKRWAPVLNEIQSSLLLRK